MAPVILPTFAIGYEVADALPSARAPQNERETRPLVRVSQMPPGRSSAVPLFVLDAAILI
jgi:hypothetical protein